MTTFVKVRAWFKMAHLSITCADPAWVMQEVMNPGGLTRYSILLLIFSQPTLLKVLVLPPLRILLHNSSSRTSPQILRICSDTRNHPVMFHCSSGKDRTGELTPHHPPISRDGFSRARRCIGLIAALILAVCGLSDEEIFDDYEKSQTYLAPCMHLIQVEGTPFSFPTNHAALFIMVHLHQIGVRGWIPNSTAHRDTSSSGPSSGCERYGAPWSDTSTTSDSPTGTYNRETTPTHTHREREAPHHA